VIKIGFDSAQPRYESSAWEDRLSVEVSLN
jgi:hypothetical protein